MATTDDRAPPILDFSPFYGPDHIARDKLIADIDRACRDKGFFQLTNTTVPQALQDRILAAAKQFFALPLEEKMMCDMRASRHIRGYERFGSQILEPGTTLDRKEAIYFGKDLPLDHPRVLAGEFNCGPNLYPPSLGQDFRDTCDEYYQAAQLLCKDVMSALALALGLDAAWFDSFVKVDPSSTLRLMHYPPTPDLGPKERGIGAHRDFGSVTVLLQDSTGGLQVQDERTGEWLDVNPVSGAFVVNVGNAIMRWTNHRYTSNTHRVMNYSTRDRYSVPFFFSGNPRQVLDVLPGCEERSDTSDRPYGPPLAQETYEPIVLQDFLMQQLSDSYARAQVQAAV